MVCEVRSLPLLAVLLFAVGFPARAQAPDPVFAPFVPYGQLQARLDDRVVEDAEIFYAERPGAYLLRSAAFAHPLLINVRDQRVERLRPAAIRDNANGTVSLLRGAAVAALGPIQVEHNRLIAALADGRRLSLGPKPHLFGPQTADALVDHDVSYGYRAGLYPPSEKVLAELRKEKRRVTVTVYFGSWCSACGRVLPWLLAVEQALAGSNISFEYYGLPHDMDDPAARAAGVQRVPTAVVRADGKELGRRTSSGLGVPEQALLEILAAD